jgi:hypothetical protein
MASPDETYTGALQNIYHTLGRIDGKLDSFDSRIRSLEEREAGRAAREALEGDAFIVLKAEVDAIKAVSDKHETQADIREAIKRYWYVAAFLLLPLLLNTAYTIKNLIGG